MGICRRQEGTGVSKNSNFADQSNWAKKGGYTDIWMDRMRTGTDKKCTGPDKGADKMGT